MTRICTLPKMNHKCIQNILEILILILEVIINKINNIIPTNKQRRGRKKKRGGEEEERRRYLVLFWVDSIEQQFVVEDEGFVYF